MGSVLTKTEARSVCYRVVVRHNLVLEIQSVNAIKCGEMEDDPLEVSTQLARNNKINGRLDGEYDFETFEAARYFATLCTEFLEKLCQRTSQALDKLERPDDGPWQNPFIPRADTS